MTIPATPVEVAFALLREGGPVDAAEPTADRPRAGTAPHGHRSQPRARVRCEPGNVRLDAG